MKHIKLGLKLFLPIVLFAGVGSLASAQENPLSPSSTKNPLERETAPAKPAPAGSNIVLKQHVMRDPGSGNMPSHTILVPRDWKVEGGAWWAPPNLFNILPSQDIKIIAPDGRMIHIGPSIVATDYRPNEMAMRQVGAKRPQERGADGGKLVLYLPDDLNEWGRFLEQNAFRSSFPNATNMRMQPVVVVPELTALVKHQLRPMQQQYEQQNRNFGGQTRLSTDGVVLAATCFYELEGKKWEHLIVFGIVWIFTDSQVGRQIVWIIEPEVSYRAEAGQLEANMPLLLSIANSMRMTNEWAQMRSDHAAKMNQIAAKGAADRSAIIARSNREISKMITDGWNERQASLDRSHYNFIKAIREVDDFTSANNPTPVQLPMHYHHVYSNGSGEYILTNDGNYNPNIDPNVNQRTWETMQKR